MRQLAKNAKYGGMCTSSIKRYEKYQKRMQNEIASAFAETTQHWASQDQELRTNWINYAIQK